MKKLIITIILLVLIAAGVLMFRALNHGATLNMDNETDTAVIVKGFIDQMIPHHQDAVDSSLKVMNDKDITNPEIRIFAANVVDEQTFEIEKMKNIYTEYLKSEYIPTITMHAATVTGSTADLKGDLLAKQYTKDMIVHHQMAIDMAKDYVRLIDKARKSTETSENGLVVTQSHPAVDETYDIAKQIIETQQKEIDQMKTWY